MRASKEVVKIDRRTWEIVQRYTSASAASKGTGVDIEKIYASANEKQFSRSSLYCFRYSDDCDLEDETSPKRGESYPIEVYDRQENKTYKFPDVATAAKALKICRATILYQIKRGKWYQGKLFTRQDVAR